MAELELIADYQCVTGEGCMWHPDEKAVYWLDIPQGRMFRYDPATGKHEQVYQGEPVGGITIQADGSLLMFGDRGRVSTWRDGLVTTVIPEIPEERESRFNDVIADPLGGVFCGTMPVGERLGYLYRLAPDKTFTRLLGGITCSNGMGFTPDRKQMYYTDSMKYEIYRFDYDSQTGAISNQRVFVRSDPKDGVPDGMTVDAEGFVWSAHWDGWCLIRYAPDGTEVMRVPFPDAKEVSCVTFGGEDYTDMYVTTAGGHDKQKNGAAAGSLYRLRLGIRGVPEFRSRIGL